MRYSKFFALLQIAAILGFADPALAHEGHDAHNDDQHSHTDLCENFTSKSENPMPNFSQPQWEVIKTLERGFRYTFYKDRTRKDISVAAISVAGAIPGANANLTRVSWQAGGKIMTARVEIDEMICVRPLYDRSGAKRDLAELMQLVEKMGAHKH